MTTQIQNIESNQDILFTEMKLKYHFNYQLTTLDKISFLQYSANEQHIVFFDGENQEINYFDVKNGELRKNLFKSKIKKCPIQ